MQWPKVKVIQRNTDNTMAKSKSKLLFLLPIALSVFLWITFSFGHCIVCISLNYFFFWTLYCLYFFELLLLVKVIQRNTDNTMAKGKSNSKKYRQYNGQKKKYFKEIQTIQWSKEKVIQRNSISLNYFYFWPLYCLYFFELLLLLAIVLSVFLWITFSFGHCIVCISLNYFYFWPLYCLYFFELLKEIQTIQWPKVKVIQRNTDNAMAKSKSNSKKYRQYNGQK
jgi:fatty acid desaturase